MAYKKVYVIIFMTIINSVKSDDNEYRLINDLLKGYNMYARPTPHFSVATNVSFDLSLSQLIDVDEKNQVMTTNCWITMFWVDNKLRWDPNEYGGLKEIRLPHDKIWKPDIILYNNADTLAAISQISTQLMIESNGNVTWLSTTIFKSACSINVRYFPFDQQNCSLPFASWTYDGNGIDLIQNSNYGDLSNYIANGEWNLDELSVYRNIKTYSCCPNPYPNITYHVIIKRRPLFYVFNMILPSMLITIVGFLGFLIPPDSGEKVSMGVTTLLSMTVFLMLVAENMPPNSDSVPLIASYYFGSMFIISLATAGTVLSLNIHKKGNEGIPVSRVVQKLFFGVIAKILLINVDLRITKHKSKIAPLRSKFNSTLSNNSRKKKELDVESLILTQTKSKSKESFRKSYCGNFDPDALSNKLLIRESPLNSKNNFRRNKFLKDYKSIDDEFSSICSDQTRETLNGTNLILKGKENEDQAFSFRELNSNQIKLIKMLNDLDQKIDTYEQREKINEYKEEIKIQWTQLAYVIDALLGYTFVISSFILIFYLIYKIPNARFY